MNAAIRKVGLIFKRHDPHVRSIVTEVVPWLQARGIEVFLEQPLTDQYPVKATVASPEIMVERVDLVAVFGGDGTLLYAARLVAGSERPIGFRNDSGVRLRFFHCARISGGRSFTPS